MTVLTCPDCNRFLPDESDLCDVCAETFASSCGHHVYERCDECLYRMEEPSHVSE